MAECTGLQPSGGSRGGRWEEGAGSSSPSWNSHFLSVSSGLLSLLHIPHSRVTHFLQERRTCEHVCVCVLCVV